ncbi:hypothetical protein [Conyzicola sp.]|uniref:hypothetical protein n=1 Tax=Conyzicola sp. TaxID=1969404 RepID=UPI00398A116D
MQITKKWQLGAFAGLTAAAVVLGAAPAAQADPASGNPVIDGFGSDTTQDVLNGLGAVITNGGVPLIGSYNAGVGLINPGVGESAPVPSIPRANGSSQGKSALVAAVDGTALTLGTLTSSSALGRDDVEFARSSSKGNWTTINETGRFSYLPFAVDAVTYAKSTAAVPSNIPLGATVGQDTDADGVLDLTLKNIYSRNAAATLENGTGTTFTVGVQGSGASIIPFKPQAGSGTLTFWQTAIGGTYGAIVSDKFGTALTPVQEHDGSVLAAVPNAIVPFSIAQHLAQSRISTLSTQYGVTVADRRFGAVLGSINGIAPRDANGNLNVNFPVNRAVFNVVETAAITPGNANYNSTLDGLFDSTSARVLTADRPGTSTALVINDFGFGAIPTAGITPMDTFTYLPGDERYRSN